MSSSCDMDDQAELDMLNSQCIVESMWYGHPYQSTVHQALSMLRRRRLFFTESTCTSPQSTKHQACQGVDVCSSQGRPVPVHSPSSVK